MRSHQGLYNARRYDRVAGMVMIPALLNGGAGIFFVAAPRLHRGGP